jgi:hypothetical protein
MVYNYLFWFKDNWPCKELSHLKFEKVRIGSRFFNDSPKKIQIQTKGFFFSNFKKLQPNLILKIK